jgi:2-polyprenyl-3-methyl-5-hydroxy-6-metoxy-1,4-benzoquinol methylase
MRVLDVGCGNGYWAGLFLERGCTVVGIDPSRSGIEIARATHPRARFEQMTVTEDLCEQLREDPFDIVVSFEVVEHLYAPSQWAKACYQALGPGGLLICSTPYHGYLKNVLISLVDGWDSHFGAIHEGGHIKFWSKRTLTRLIVAAGFEDVRFRGAGRFPYIWKSMVLSARRCENHSSG